MATNNAGMRELLYKVAAPGDDWIFEPRPFFHAPDWSSSYDPQEEHDLPPYVDVATHVEDCVLFVAGFDEVNMHLLPKVWKLRVWLDDQTRVARLRELGYSWTPGSRAVIFALESDREAIESFTPTVFTFNPDGFELTPSNEFISRKPRVAVSSETLPFRTAQSRWAFELIYISDAESLTQSLQAAGVDHQIDV